MKKTLLTLFALSLSSSWLPAKEINFPDSSNWMISFDVKAFHESRMGKFIFGKMNEDPNINQKMLGLKNAFGVDLLKIREISAFGSGEKDMGTALIRGGINSKQLEGFASLNDKVEIGDKGDKKTYTLKKGSLGILSGDSVAVASNKELLEEALIPKNAKKKPSPLHSFVHSIKKEEAPIMWFAANVLKVNRLQNKIKADQETTPKQLAESISKSLNSVMAGEILFKKFRNMAFFLDETNDHIRIKVYLQSANDEVAEHLENIFRSWPSLLALTDGVNPELDEVMKHVKFSVLREKKSVGMTVLLSHSFFETKVNEEIKKKKKAKEDSK
ncbi:MAG TPA: hypothetical protein DCF87_05420 [Opitutae bacterium]|nr:hypothetical protein [Opitutae bacterium]